MLGTHKLYAYNAGPLPVISRVVIPYKYVGRGTSNYSLIQGGLLGSLYTCYTYVKWSEITPISRMK